MMEHMETEDPPQSRRSFTRGMSKLALERTLSVQQARVGNIKLPTDVVVKIHGTGVRPSYLMPWQVQSQKMWTGTGFVLPGRKIMTNAHVVQDATVLQVTKQDDPKKFHARLVCVAHDLDLALLSVEDEKFWQDLSYAEFADAVPELYSEIKAVGFPTGGATVCVTKGILSRIDAGVYVHPQILGVNVAAVNDSITIMQIDAAINPGNSGGPAFDNQGKVVGIASSGLPQQQNVGYIIPFSIATMFLEEVCGTGRWSGISEIGISVVTLENDSMREFLAMGAHKGVLVSKVAPLGALHGRLEEGDVITQVDGLDVTNEADIPYALGEQKIYMSMDSVHTQKAKGGVTTFGILRNGESMTLEAVLHPIPPLAPRFHGYDAQPEFLIIGGVVFTQGTVPLFNEWRRTKNSLRLSSSAVWTHFDAFKEDPEHEIVVLLTILTHEVNQGYDHCDGILHSFNDQKVRSLAQLSCLYGEAMAQPWTQLTGDPTEFLRFCVGGAEVAESKKRRPDIILDRAKVEAADQEICAVNRIPDIASALMMRHVRGETVTVPEVLPLNTTEAIMTELLAALPSLQVGSNGLVDRADLTSLLVTVSGGAVSPAQAEEFISSACPDKTGAVPYSQFINYVFQANRLQP